MGRGWRTVSRVVLALGLFGAAGAAQAGAPVMSGKGYGTEWVDPKVVLAGPVFTHCGEAALPIKGGFQGRIGCPSAVIVVPGHYRPVPMEGWELTGAEKRHLLFLTYECVSHWILGIVPLPISKECVGPAGPRKMDDYLLSWNARPVSWGAEAPVAPWREK